MILSSFWRRVLGMSDKPKIVDALGAYQASNILGTVSQSGGIPTGALVESGSNANGRYVRYADGTQICWGTDTVIAIVVNTATGAFFTNIESDQVIWTYPASFVGTPMVNVTLARNAWDTIRVTAFLNGANAVSATQCKISFMSSLSSVSLGVVPQRVAVGRWF